MTRGGAACQGEPRPRTPDVEHVDTTTPDVKPGDNAPDEDTRARPTSPDTPPKQLTQFSMIDVNDRAEALRRDHARALAALEAVFEAVVAEALGRVMRTALNNLGPGITAAGEEEILDLNALSAITNLWAAEVDGPVGVGLMEMFTAGGLSTWLTFPEAYDEAIKELGGLDPVLNEHAAEYMATSRNRLVGIGDTAWSMARRELEAGFRAGEGIEELRDRVAKVLRSSEVRARIIARTETVSASNAGSVAGARSLGEFAPLYKEWLATKDSRTRDSHWVADGQLALMADPFYVNGYAMDVPGDPNAPASETVNCRCTVLFHDEPLGLRADGQEVNGMATRVKRARRMRSTTFAGRDGAGVAVAAAAAVARMGKDEAKDEAEIEVIETKPENRPDTPMKDEETVDTERAEEWHTLMVVEGVPTGDRRLIEEGALTWRDLPLPLMWQEQQPEFGGHSLSVHVGQITRVERQGAEIHAWGYCLRDDEDGARFADLLDEAGKLGVSVDMDDVDVEIDWPDDEEDDDEGMFLFPEPELVRFTKARLMGCTSVPFPAFSEAFIEPIAVDDAATGDDEEVPGDIAPEDAAIVAAAAPELPPLEWFDDPSLDGPTPLTITDDGRVYGHLAAWGSCHTGMAGMCVTPPTNASGYAYYRTGEVLCEKGDRVAVGQITLGAGHADKHASPQAAMAHYDNVATAVADVSCGEDMHGIWFAGSLRPGVTAEQVRQLRAAGLSGDWRRIGGSLELVAALAVNVQGYPIPRTSAVIASGVQVALIASGVIPPGYEPSKHAALDAIAERIAASVGRDRRSRAKALSDRVHGLAEFACGTCGQKRQRTVVAAGQQRTINASAASTSYQVLYPNGDKETVGTLLEARRNARNNAGAKGGRGVIKVI